LSLRITWLQFTNLGLSCSLPSYQLRSFYKSRVTDWVQWATSSYC